MTHVATPTENRRERGASSPSVALKRAVMPVLRGISQVFLQRNAASGALILVGLSTYS